MFENLREKLKKDYDLDPFFFMVILIAYAFLVTIILIGSVGLAIATGGKIIPFYFLFIGSILFVIWWINKE